MLLEGRVFSKWQTGRKSADEYMNECLCGCTSVSGSAQLGRFNRTAELRIALCALHRGHLNAVLSVRELFQKLLGCRRRRGHSGIIRGLFVTLCGRHEAFFLCGSDSLRVSGAIVHSLSSLSPGLCALCVHTLTNNSLLDEQK